MFPFSEKVKIPYLLSRGKQSYAEDAKISHENESPSCEIVNKDKEIHASLLSDRERPHSHSFYNSLLL